MADPDPHPQRGQKARQAYPGPVGELLAVELNAYADLDFLWTDATAGRRMRAVVEDVLSKAGV